MADLTIKDATFGMNTDGAEQYIEDLRDEYLKEAGKQLEEETKNLNEKLKAVWQGQGRDNFYKSIKTDADALHKKLEDLADDLEKAFEKARDSLNKFDQSIVVERIVK